MLRIAWRLHRSGLLGMTAFGFLYGLFQASAYQTAAGTTEVSRVAFGRQMEVLGTSISYLLPLPVHLENLGGFVQWRVYGALPLVVCIWAVFSAAGATRGDEDRGLLEIWLGTGLGRIGYLLSRLLAFGLVALIVTGSAAAGILVTAAGAHVSLPAAGLAQQTLALFGITLAAFAVTVLASQFCGNARTAAGLGGGILLVLFFINSLSRSVGGLRPLATAVSPFHYYDLNTPLRSGGAFDPIATGLLLGLSMVLVLTAAVVMRGRDIGSARLRWRPRDTTPQLNPSTNPLLRLPILAPLYDHRLSILVWALGCAAGAALIGSLGRQMVSLVNGGGAFGAYLTAAGHGDPYVAVTGFFWFGIFQLLLAGFAISVVARWAADDDEGRLEMMLSAPISRTRIVFERAAVALVEVALLIAVSSSAFLLSAKAAGIGLRLADLGNASWPLVPFALSFAAIGALVAGRRPRAAVDLLATVALLGYLVTDGAPLLRLPPWTVRLSPFSLYGKPLADGVDWIGASILALVAVAGFGLAALAMRRREVGA